MFFTLLAEEYRTFQRFYLILAAVSLVMYAGLGLLAGLVSRTWDSGEHLALWLGSIALLGEMVIICLILLRHWADYWESLHGSRASFTHAIPVKARWIFLAKVFSLLAGMVFLFVWQSAMRFLFGLLNTGDLARAWERSMYLWNDAGVQGAPFLVRLPAMVALWLMPLLVFAGMSLGSAPNFLGGHQRWRGNRKQIIAGRAHPVAGVSFALVWTLACTMVGFLGIPVGALSVRGQYQGIVFGENVDPSKYVQVMPADAGVEYLGGYFTSIAAVLILCWWAVRSLEKHLHVR